MAAVRHSRLQLVSHHRSSLLRETIVFAGCVSQALGLERNVCGQLLHHHQHTGGWTGLWRLRKRERSREVHQSVQVSLPGAPCEP